MIYLLATNNPGKAREIKPMFDMAGLTLITLADLGLHFEAREDGTTFAHNATQKARETAAFLQSAEISKDINADAIAVLADDSGLEIDALNGEPGVDSALYMGRDTPYTDKCKNLLDRLAATPENMRTARFICMLACIRPGGRPLLLAEGTIEGRIAHAASGEGGFGYDPIFYYPPHGKTLAELSQDEKNHISHRGQAIQKMIGLITSANSSTK